jgi:hypothetical protein
LTPAPRRGVPEARHCTDDGKESSLVSCASIDTATDPLMVAPPAPEHARGFPNARPGLRLPSEAPPSRAKRLAHGFPYGCHSQISD